jgi:hypothetical protein
VTHESFRNGFVWEGLNIDLRTTKSLTIEETARRRIDMMFLRTDFGCKATREGATAAAYLRSLGHSLVATQPGRPSTNKDWIGPGS